MCAFYSRQESKETNSRLYQTPLGLFDIGSVQVSPGHFNLTVVSNYIWAKAIVLTSPLVATIGLPGNRKQLFAPQFSIRR
jgi:hypothetical protein